MLRACLRASRYFDILRCANGCQLWLLLGEEIQQKLEKSLTSEMKIDNLEKFAKTSLVAEVILDRLKLSQQEIAREI